MPYHYPDQIPNVAKNWSPNRQKKCAEVADAVLRNGGSESEVIFACIHAAKQKQDDKKYDQFTEDAALDFQHLLELYFAGEITLDVFQSTFQDKLKEHYTKLMLLGLAGKREVSEEDLVYLNSKLDEQFKYLDGFVEDLREGRMTQQRALWRAGRYGFPRAAFINYTVPKDIVELMGVLPGDDCLGDGLCGCSLEVEFDSDGTAYVYWVLDPMKESCAVCIAHAVESPYIFTAEEVAGVHA